MQLRDFQRESIDQGIYDYFRAKPTGNPLVVAPTGAGKSVIIGALCKEAHQQWPDTRILMATHVKELIQQNYQRAKAIWRNMPIGICAAGLNKKVYGQPITFGSVQTMYNKAKKIGHIDLMLIDECHLVPFKGTSMYRTFIDSLLEINPHMRVCGFTATPFRLDGGLLHTGKNRLFTDISYDIPITLLIERGYLVPPRAKSGKKTINRSELHIRAGDFRKDELEAIGEDEELMQASVEEMLEYGQDRKAWLVFCNSVKHSEEMALRLRERGIDTEAVHGQLDAKERDLRLKRYLNGNLRCLTNCNILTTGFDAPATDFLVMLRPTESTALYIQMVGRGLRISPETGKEDCLVLDFAGNVLEHGPIDKVNVTDTTPGEGGEAPSKECPECHEIVHAAVVECPACGFEFPRREVTHQVTANTAALLSQDEKPEWLLVDSVNYYSHRSRLNKPPSLRVDYICGIRVITEWVPIENEKGEGLTRRWFSDRGLAAPDTVAEALAYHASIPTPKAIQVERDGKYWRVKDSRFGADADGAFDQPDTGFGHG